MIGHVTPEAEEMLMLMTDGVVLPADWETSGFWQIHAQQLAQFLAGHKGELPLKDAAMLIATGGMMVKMARREREAAALAACFFDRAAKGGAA